MENFGKHAPCLEKNCSFCCDPVKINQRAIRLGFKSPLNKEGEAIWKATGEILAPLERIDTDRIATFECTYHDKETGICLEYENRPEICRNTTCIKSENENIDDQHKRMTEVKFIKIK